VRVFAIDTALATDVSGVPALMGTAYAPVSKELLFDFEADLGIVPQNIEGMVLGPRLADGRQVLIFVSDNNFSVLQETQFVAVAVDLSARD
jgi:3-phytase/alkaline phosphatase D